MVDEGAMIWRLSGFPSIGGLGGTVISPLMALAAGASHASPNIRMSWCVDCTEMGPLPAHDHTMKTMPSGVKVGSEKDPRPWVTRITVWLIEGRPAVRRAALGRVSPGPDDRPAGAVWLLDSCVTKRPTAAATTPTPATPASREESADADG